MILWSLFLSGHYHIKAHQRWWDDVLEESRKLAMGTASPDAKSKAKLSATFDEMVKKLKDYNAVNKVPENLGIVTFKTLYDYWASPHGVQKDQTRAQCVLGQVPLGWMDGENEEDYPTADQWRQEVDRLGAEALRQPFRNVPASYRRRSRGHKLSATDYGSTRRPTNDTGFK